MTSPFSKPDVTFDKTLAVSREVLRPAIPAKTLTQYLGRVVHLPGQQIEALIGFGTIGADGLIAFDDSSIKVHTFTGAAYAALMSESPEWSPNKPAGVYRDTDIFAFVDWVASEIAREKRVEADKAAALAEEAESEATNAAQPAPKVKGE